MPLQMRLVTNKRKQPHRKLQLPEGQAAGATKQQHSLMVAHNRQKGQV